MSVTLRVNGREVELVVAEDAPLLCLLRNDLELNGPKFGCGLGQWGACTVLVEGSPQRSCLTPVASVRVRDLPLRPERMKAALRAGTDI